MNRLRISLEERLARAKQERNRLDKARAAPDYDRMSGMRPIGNVIAETLAKARALPERKGN